MKTILWLNPTGRDKREIQHIRTHNNLHVIYHTYASESLRTVCAQKKQRATLAGCRMPRHEINRLITVLDDMPIDGVLTSRSYPSNIIAAALAEAYALPSISVTQSILTQHKYYARRILDNVAPEANPAYELLPHNDVAQCSLTPPYIIKPVTAAISMGTHYISCYDDLTHIHNMPSHGYFEPLAEFMHTYTPYQLNQSYLIAESYTPGHQVTMDMCVYNNTVYIIGIVDSHFYPETLSFSAFTYPSQLSQSIQHRMKTIAQNSVDALGLNNLVCNIEFIYNDNDDTITLIEINPRMSSQFNTCYRYVDGINMYHIAIDIATGNKPHIPYTSGPYACAASFALRTYTDQYVAATPSHQEIRNIHARYPHAHIEICCQPGRYLSEFPQDTYTYLYAIINVCGNNHDELHAICSDIQHMLPFSFT